MYLQIICCLALLVFGQVVSEISSQQVSNTSQRESGIDTASVEQTPAFLSDCIPTTSFSAPRQETVTSARSRLLKANDQAILIFSMHPTPSIRTYIPGIVGILPGLSPVNIAYPFQDFI